MQLPHIPTWSPNAYPHLATYCKSPLGNPLPIPTWPPTVNPHLVTHCQSPLATHCQFPLGNLLSIPTWPHTAYPHMATLCQAPMATHCPSNSTTHYPLQFGHPLPSPLCHQLLIDPLSLIMLFANKRPLSPYLFNAFCNALRCSRTRTVLKLSST